MGKFPDDPAASEDVWLVVSPVPVLDGPAAAALLSLLLRAISKEEHGMEGSERDEAVRS